MLKDDNAAEEFLLGECPTEVKGWWQLKSSRVYVA